MSTSSLVIQQALPFLSSPSLFCRFLPISCVFLVQKANHCTSLKILRPLTYHLCIIFPIFRFMFHNHLWLSTRLIDWLAWPRPFTLHHVPKKKNKTNNSTHPQTQPPNIAAQIHHRNTTPLFIARAPARSVCVCVCFCASSCHMRMLCMCVCACVHPPVVSFPLPRPDNEQWVRLLWWS